MTTLIIEIPDSDANEISNIVKARGGNVVEIDGDDENLTPIELELLKRGMNEALLIKEGKIKSIPFPNFGMTNTVEISPEFKRDIKPLAKKYHTLKQSVNQLQKNIIENPNLGVSYGNGMFKVRLGDESKGSGKSGGFRVLYYHLEKTDTGITILLTNIFDKSETGTIKKQDAIRQLDDIIKEYRSKK